VLIVDDSPDITETLSLLVETVGHEVRTANSGVDGIAVASTFEPDVVLLDLGMPDIDGFEVAERLRASPFGEQLTLIAVTGWVGRAHRARSRKSGFDFFFAKPVTIVQLRDVLALVQRFKSAAP
jgi:CheY-like chemotaxis protein